MIRKENWIEYFPFDTPRDTQIESIDFILNSFINSNKRFVICELPTGTGKSAIAITIAKYFENTLSKQELSSYIITTQKVLQEQYVKDYNIPKIWAKSNYTCKNRLNISCQFGTWINNIFKNNNYCECIYDKEKKIFLESEISITNVPYMLHHIEYNIYELKNRKLLIIDECHNIESAIIDFVSLEINRIFLEDNDIKWNNSKNLDIIINWLKGTVYNELDLIKNSLLQKIKLLSSQSIISSDGKILIKKLDEIESYLIRLDRVLSKFPNNEWVLSFNSLDDIMYIKPIYASNFCDELLFKICDKVLLMSSTILNKDTFCNNLGIDINDCEFISLDSPFKVENRPIIFFPIASMSYKNINESLPKMLGVIKDIINIDQKNNKGIIHCVNYKIAEYLFRNVKSNRFLIHNSDNRMDVLKTHILSKEPTILLSPSLTEGIDLIDNLSRFQIIVKVPFPYLGDDCVIKKMKKVKDWYEWNTVKTIIQSSGRSIRTEDDYAYTYILDSDFDFFYKKNEKLFPDWFKNAIIKI